MDFRELRYFVALAEEQHFGRAAERLFIAQSGLSRAIRRSEDELGVALFARTRRHVELTAAGAALLERVYDVLNGFEGVRSTAEAARAGMVGTLTVATSAVARYQVAFPIFERFAGRCADIHLIHREQLAGEIVDDLLADALDLGIAFCTPPHTALVVEPLREVEMRVLISSSHPLAARGQIALAELRDERFLIQAEVIASGSIARVQPIFQAAGFQPKFVRHVVDHDEDFQGVSCGEGVVLSGRTFLGDYPPGVSALRLQPPTTLPLELVRRAGEPSAIEARFIEIVRQVAIEQGWRAVDGAGTGSSAK
jgi:DNA-binding transcriptional LysR family regulator